jgi:head-tail adaptor
MPVRRVSNRGGNAIGRFPSLKVGRMVEFESLIERDYLYLLDHQADVEWFEEQPMTVKYRQDEQDLHYTPDFHVVQGGSNFLVECKPHARVANEENQRKFRAARDWCAEHGWAFQVVTDQEIRAGWRLKNVRFLTRYARLRISPEVRGRILNCLLSAAIPMSLDDLVEKAACNGNDAEVIATILSMAFHHKVSVPLDDAPISGRSLVSLPRNQEERNP